MHDRSLSTTFGPGAWENRSPVVGLWLVWSFDQWGVVQTSEIYQSSLFWNGTHSFAISPYCFPFSFEYFHIWYLKLHSQNQKTCKLTKVGPGSLTFSGLSKCIICPIVFFSGIICDYLMKSANSSNLFSNQRDGKPFLSAPRVHSSSKNDVHVNFTHSLLTNYYCLVCCLSGLGWERNPICTRWIHFYPSLLLAFVYLRETVNIDIATTPSLDFNQHAFRNLHFHV